MHGPMMQHLAALFNMHCVRECPSTRLHTTLHIAGPVRALHPASSFARTCAPYSSSNRHPSSDLHASPHHRRPLSLRRAGLVHQWARCLLPASLRLLSWCLHLSQLQLRSQSRSHLLRMLPQLCAQEHPRRSAALTASLHRLCAPTSCGEVSRQRCDRCEGGREGCTGSVSLTNESLHAGCEQVWGVQQDKRHGSGAFEVLVGSYLIDPVGQARQTLVVQ
jgi:hypothetical protein